MYINLNHLLKVLYYLTLGYFTYLMILITVQYVPIKLDAAFLNVKQDEIKHVYYQIAFFAHVYTSIFVLIAGIIQFSRTIRKRFPKWHVSIGKLYVFLILFIAAPSGLVMAVHANGGFFSKISFVIQAVLWFGFTYRAYSAAREHDWVEHRNFMVRTYALTLSAISLRLFKWIIVSTLALPPMDTYKIVSWLGWTVNMLLAEYYIFSRKKN